MKRGFSLIELLVVFAIIALILGIAIPGFSNYNKAQILKTAAYDLKAVLREAQNASLQGRKEGGCSESEVDRVLIGHYVTFAKNQTSTAVWIRCGVNDPLDYSVKEVQLSSNGTIYVDDVIRIRTGYQDMTKSPARVIFKPVNQGVGFIDGDQSFNESPWDGLRIILSNGSDNHEVYISSSGDIYEKKVEPE